MMQAPLLPAQGETVLQAGPGPGEVPLPAQDDFEAQMEARVAALRQPSNIEGEGRAAPRASPDLTDLSWMAEMLAEAEQHRMDDADARLDAQLASLRGDADAGPTYAQLEARMAALSGDADAGPVGDIAAQLAALRGAEPLDLSYGVPSSAELAEELAEELARAEDQARPRRLVELEADPGVSELHAQEQAQYEAQQAELYAQQAEAEELARAEEQAEEQAQEQTQAREEQARERERLENQVLESFVYNTITKPGIESTEHGYINQQGESVHVPIPTYISSVYSSDKINAELAHQRANSGDYRIELQLQPEPELVVVVEPGPVYTHEQEQLDDDRIYVNNSVMDGDKILGTVQEISQDEVVTINPSFGGDRYSRDIHGLVKHYTVRVLTVAGDPVKYSCELSCGSKPIYIQTDKVKWIERYSILEKWHTSLGGIDEILKDMFPRKYEYGFLKNTSSDKRSTAFAQYYSRLFSTARGGSHRTLLITKGKEVNINFARPVALDGGGRKRKSSKRRVSKRKSSKRRVSKRRVSKRRVSKRRVSKRRVSKRKKTRRRRR
jgi:hypothetical protein